MSETIGNRPEKAAQERDCVIRAISTACELDYHLVAITLRYFGKRNNCGMRLEDFLKRYGGIVFGWKWEEADWPEATGRWVLRMPGHVWAFVDGKHYDLRAVDERQKRRIDKVWRVTFVGGSDEPRKLYEQYERM